MNTALALICGVLVLGGCASSQAGKEPTVATQTTQTEAQPKPSTDGGEMGHDMAATCPMTVEGTSARAEDVQGGAALAFTTTGDVAELRRRVAHMVEMHEKHHGEGHGAGMGGGGADKGMMGGHEGMMGGDKGMMGGDKGMMGGHEGMMMPPATARSEEIEGGARLIFTPRDAADLPKLRDHARQHAEKMASGQCPMMAMHGHEAAAGEPGAHDAHQPDHKD
jgi:hypothetical protein